MDRDHAIELLKSGRFEEALPKLQKIIESDPYDYQALYMAGQCCRFTNRINEAISYLIKAVDLKDDEPVFYLGLGIAQQLNEEFDKAIISFLKAIDIDSNYDLAYNSLALTYKKMGSIKSALDTYDAGIKALSRNIVNAMHNDINNQIVPEFHTPQFIWSEYAMYGAMYLCSHDDKVTKVAWPTGEQAEEEARSKRHGGLFWTDISNHDDGIMRLFLPNYFNTFVAYLLRDKTYANLVGNRGTVLELAGQADDAEKHFEEASYFDSLVS